MNQYSNNHRNKRKVSVPDFRHETEREYQYSKRPNQTNYLKGTEWDRSSDENHKRTNQEKSRRTDRTRTQTASQSSSRSAQRTRQGASNSGRTMQQSRSGASNSSRNPKQSQYGTTNTGRSGKQMQPGMSSNIESTQQAKHGTVTEAPETEKISGKRKADLKKRRKRSLVLRRIGIVCFCLIAILSGHIIGRWNAQINDIFNQRNQAAIDLNEVQIDENTLDSDKDIINILLVGADKRETWSESGRSDCVMVATLDKKHKRLKLTSLMRDMYVEIPNHGQDKFNAAYSYGGIKLLYQTIAKNFDLKLDGYVLVDFAAFKSVIREIGGVEIELTDAEATYLQTAYHSGPVTKVKAGLHTLSAPQVLAYARIRQDNAADFGRTARQRKVMQAIFTKAKTKSYSKLLDLAKTIMPYITTDLSNEEIYGYLSDIVMMGTTDIDQQRIPVDNSFQSHRINTQMVLCIDLETNKKALQDFIYQYNGS